MTTRADSSHEPWVLGISASHNGGACILQGDRIVAAIQEERLSRSKRDRVYGARESLAVGYCLQAAGIKPGDLDLVVLCGQEGVNSDEYDLAFNRQLALVRGKVPWLTISHHLGHAAHAFATSGFEDAAVLVVDGLGSPFEDLSPEEQAVAADSVGGWETVSLYEASGTTITPLEKHLVVGENWLQPRPEGMPRFRSLGGIYSAAASQLFGNPMEAGKVMGLAPYGTPTIAPGEFFTLADGRFHFHDGVPERFNHHRKWPDCEREYRDLAASVQGALEVAIDHLVDRLASLSSSPRLCYSGGVALNCIANERIIRGSRFRDVYIPPAAEDSGVAMGAAYFGLWHLTGRNTRRALRKDAVGRVYSRDEIDRAIQATPGVKVTTCGAEEVLDATVARLIDGEFGGWFQGASELGPRALGGRSIVADPRRPDAKDQLNGRVKHREAFQPFAPAILEDQADEWFELDGTTASSPFMLRVWPFKPEARDRVPAVVHVDGTGRVETVSRDGDHPFYPLLDRFARATGVPIVLNTSFNGRGEPIVETPEDALWCMLETGLDFVVLEDRLVERDESTRSLLDLVPVLLAKQFTLDVIRRREASEDRPADTVLTVRVRTPWGSREERLPSTIHPLITAIDGVTNGWALLERIGANTGRAPEPRQLAGALSQLRRASIIDLRAHPPAA
ncbi:MAG: carbamoyltransferase [Longimicrobiaceae bacterium]